jgi:hypothetical protein
VRIVPDGERGVPSERRVPAWVVCALMLGVYLTTRGYHSFDGDQAYRLPLLLHHQDSRIYSDDPFVRSFDAFNPHCGSLIVLDALTRGLGLSAGLFVLFVLTFVITCRAVERLGRAVWPDSGPNIGWVAVTLLLAAKAGNIGTNHLFEAMVLDRLMALALGWQALATAVSSPEQAWWRSSAAIGLATWIHPSAGLQLAMVLAASWVAWSLVGRRMEVSAGMAIRSLAMLTLAVLPGLVVNVPSGASLTGTLPESVFWLLSVELQSPQHMLPHLWRMPQWLSWSCYLTLATLQLGSGGFTRALHDCIAYARRTPPSPPFVRGRKKSGELPRLPPLTKGGLGGVYSQWPPARCRLVASLAVILAGLGVAWFAIEVLHQVRVTIFQPFRMATLARGMAIVMVSGRLVALWRSSGPLNRVRAIVLATGFLGDWLMVVATLAEVAVSIVEAVASRFVAGPVKAAVFLGAIAWGINFLGHHDTESGHIPLLAALGLGLAVAMGKRWTDRRQPHAAPARMPRPACCWALALTAAWLIPIAALLAGVSALNHPEPCHPLVKGLIDRCRFVPVPLDDIERLALWCREHTHRTACFIGPPGPKTFRLWSRRSLAFSRAASPYHAAGLADWFARFQEHVDFHGTPADFVRAYLADRHRFEARYQALSEAQRAGLAVRQGASYVIAAAPQDDAPSCNSKRCASPLELVHAEGRFAVYRVRSPEGIRRHR